MSRILVLDDDADAAESMAQGLAGPDRQVRAFADPVRALAALDEEPADLVVLDFLMPWIDGGDVVTAVRRVNPSARLLIVSGVADAAPWAARSGIPFLPKPIELPRLRERVDELLREAAELPTL